MAPTTRSWLTGWTLRSPKTARSQCSRAQPWLTSPGRSASTPAAGAGARDRGPGHAAEVPGLPVTGSSSRVPALAALGRPERLGALRARRARVPARDQHLLDVAGTDVGAAELDRPDTRPVLGRQVLDHIPGQRHREPLRACPAAPPPVESSPPVSSPSLSQAAA